MSGVIDCDIKVTRCSGRRLLVVRTVSRQQVCSILILNYALDCYVGASPGGKTLNIFSLCDGWFFAVTDVVAGILQPLEPTRREAYDDL